MDLTEYLNGIVIVLCIVVVYLLYRCSSLEQRLSVMENSGEKSAKKSKKAKKLAERLEERLNLIHMLNRTAIPTSGQKNKSEYLELNS